MTLLNELTEEESLEFFKLKGKNSAKRNDFSTISELHIKT